MSNQLSHDAPQATYDALLWELRTYDLTKGEAAIQRSGAVVVYRKDRKPALGPLGDTLDDMEACR